jgi:hypothetical protein
VALEGIADKVVACDEDTRFVDALELEVAVIVGLADDIDVDMAEWLELVELVDTFDPEDVKRVEIMELDVPVKWEVVMGADATMFVDAIELSSTVVPFQTTWQELVLKSAGILSQRRRSLPKTYIAFESMASPCLVIEAKNSAAPTLIRKACP